MPSSPGTERVDFTHSDNEAPGDMFPAVDATVSTSSKKRQFTQERATKANAAMLVEPEQTIGMFVDY